MKVILAGGGTGGHVYPAIAIAEKIKQRHPSAQILFVGADHGLEKKVVPEHGYPIEFITVSGFYPGRPLWNIKALKKLYKGSREAKKIIADFRPDLAIGTGGYVCGPTIREAGKAGVKTYIHEQNAYPGKTNRLLERQVETVFLGFEAAAPFFKQPAKHILSGNPVRDGFIEADKQSSRKKLGFAKDDFVLLAFGGSQGAGRINKAMVDVIEATSGKKKMQVCLGAGERYYNGVLTALADRGVKPKENIHILPYIDKMELYLSAADLVVSRSGALTVAEVTVCGKAAIFVPSPTVAGNHQYFNAKAVSDGGGAVILEEKHLENGQLLAKIQELKEDPDTLEEISRRSKEFAPADAAEIICDHLEIGV